MIKIRCTQCKRFKTPNEFAWKNRSDNSRSSECKECHRKARKKVYLANTADEKERVKARKDAIREYVRSKRNACVQCGEAHPATLQFHHMDPEQKDISLAEAITRGWSFKRIDQEIAKCIVLCANCHAKVHFEEKRKDW